MNNRDMRLFHFLKSICDAGDPPSRAPTPPDQTSPHSSQARPAHPPRPVPPTLGPPLPTTPRGERGSPVPGYIRPSASDFRHHPTTSYSTDLPDHHIHSEPRTHLDNVIPSPEDHIGKIPLEHHYREQDTLTIGWHT